VSKIRHSLPKALIGDDSTDTSQLIHAGIGLTYGSVCLNHGCACLCVVHLNEDVADFDLLPLMYIDSLDEAW
jgi:hypothetical protein